VSDVGIFILLYFSFFLSFFLFCFNFPPRRKSATLNYEQPYVKKPMVKKYAGKGANHNPEEAAMESANKILTFGSMPSYR
jgi:hypothetical protein